MVNLTGLPVELLYEIHVQSLSPQLPLVSRRLWDIFRICPVSIRAEYLLQTQACHLDDSFSSSSVNINSAARPVWSVSFHTILSNVLRYPIACDAQVLQNLKRLYVKFGAEPSGIGSRGGGGGAKAKRRRSVGAVELPRHLFRPPASSKSGVEAGIGEMKFGCYREEENILEVLSALEHLAHVEDPSLSSPSSSSPSSSSRFPSSLKTPTYTIDYDSNHGYALTMAVHRTLSQLVRFLLAKDANPGMKDGLAVKVAIRKRDLGLVRTLIERSPPQSSGSSSPPPLLSFRNDDEGQGDRMEVTSALVSEAVLMDARDIVDYFVRVKGCAPDLKSLAAIPSVGPGARKKGASAREGKKRRSSAGGGRRSINAYGLLR